MNQERSQIGYLERWELPFSDKICPSVSIIVTPEDFNRVKVVVMPKGLSEYPGYLIDFQAAPLFKFYDETCAPPLIPKWFDLLRAIPKSSAVIWHGSPLARQFTGIGGGRYYAQDEKLLHYLILGGDSIVEILAYQPPSVRQFNERQKFIMEYSF